METISRLIHFLKIKMPDLKVPKKKKRYYEILKIVFLIALFPFQLLAVLPKSLVRSCDLACYRKLMLHEIKVLEINAT